MTHTDESGHQSPSSTTDSPTDATDLVAQATEAADRGFFQLLCPTGRAFAGENRPHLEILAALQAMRDEATRLLESSALLAHKQGATWQQIGNELGITRQAAQKRFG